MNKDMKIKRERSANFTLNERDMLISLIKAHRDVIENKESDASSWKKKDAAWANIEKEFNARIGGVFRSSKTLRIKYEGLKRLVRKKSAAIRAELYRTGGGPNSAVPLDSVEEQIRELISLSTDGLESVYDSDVLPRPSTQTQASQDDLSVVTLDELIILPQPTSDTCMDFKENGRLDIKVPDEVQFVTKVPVEEKVFEDSNLYVTNTTLTTGEATEEKFLDNTLEKTPCEKYAPTPSTTHKKWDVTSRNNLKSRRHPALIAPKKQHLDDFTQARLELVQLQKTLLEAEQIEKKKEWEFQDKERKWKEEERQKEREFRDKERKWKEEEYKLRMEKLRMELKN